MNIKNFYDTAFIWYEAIEDGKVLGRFSDYDLAKLTGKEICRKYLKITPRISRGDFYFDMIRHTLLDDGEINGAKCSADCIISDSTYREDLLKSEIIYVNGAEILLADLNKLLCGLYKR